MAVLYAACPMCGKKKRKPKGKSLPPRVWECANCGAVYRVSHTHQPSLWRKMIRRRGQGREPDPSKQQFNTYLVEVYIDENGKRKARPLAAPTASP